MKREPGQTRDTGFQVGVRRTLPLSPEDAWRLVTSPAAVREWLGDGAEVEWERGRTYALADGAAGESAWWSRGATCGSPGGPRGASGRR